MPEVAIYHNAKLLRANRTIKNRCKGSEIFHSPNYPALGSTSNQDTKIYWENVRDFSLEGAFYSRSLELVESYSSKVIILTLHPSLNDYMLELIYGADTDSLYEAIIIEAFGLGNLPSNTRLRELIQQKTAKGSRR